MCDLVSKLIQVFIVFVDDISTVVGKFAETQEVQNHSKGENVGFEGKISEWPTRVFLSKNFRSAVRDCPCRAS
jgi:hypothetical protein